MVQTIFQIDLCESYSAKNVNKTIIRLLSLV